MKYENIMRLHKRQGTATVEFVLAGSFIFLPLLAGLATVGMSMVMAIQVVGLNRDAGRLFSGGVDFSQLASQSLLAKIAGNLNSQLTGGTGIVILSEIDGTGTNPVCSRQLVVGSNKTLKSSAYVNPSPGLLDSSGDVSNTSDASAQVTNFPLTMTQGQVAYLVETYFSTSQYLSGTGIYAKAIF